MMMFFKANSDCGECTENKLDRLWINCCYVSNILITLSNKSISVGLAVFKAIYCYAFSHDIASEMNILIYAAFYANI